MVTQALQAIMTPIEIYLSSEYSIKNDPFCNDCTYKLPRQLVAPDGYSFYVSVISFTCPVSWLIVNIYNNILIIDEIEVIVPHGNYSIFQLVKTVQSLLPSGITLTYDSIAMRCTLQSNAIHVVQGPLCELLGFKQGSSGTTILSYRIVDMTGNNSVYIMTNLQSGQSNIDARGIDSANVLCRIPVSTQPGSIIDYQDFSGRAGLLLDNDCLNTIQIRLQDEDNRSLLCTLDYDLCLQVQFIPNTQQRLQRDIPVELSTVTKPRFTD